MRGRSRPINVSWVYSSVSFSPVICCGYVNNIQPSMLRLLHGYTGHACVSKNIDVCSWTCPLTFAYLRRTSFRDWSLITGRGGGATQWKNRGSKTFCAPPPPPQDRVKRFARPPPPFCRGKTSRAPLPFCSPPSLPLPVISDQSLRSSLIVI